MEELNLIDQYFQMQYQRIRAIKRVWHGTDPTFGIRRIIEELPYLWSEELRLDLYNLNLDNLKLFKVKWSDTAFLSSMRKLKE